MSRWPFTVAHVLKEIPPRPLVAVYRTHARATLAGALSLAGEIARAGYLVWIERTGWVATR